MEEVSIMCNLKYSGDVDAFILYSLFLSFCFGGSEGVERDTLTLSKCLFPFIYVFPLFPSFLAVQFIFYSKRV
jgi:hypothetical protein